jgi:integrase
MAKLTIRAVEALKPGDRERFVWDGEMRGFGMRVLPTGIKTFVVQYRTGARRQRRMVLGRYGVLSPEAARKEARQALALVAKGKDPAAEREKTREAGTVAKLCDRYLAEHAVPFKKASSVGADRQLIEANVMPHLGRMPVSTVTRADVLKMRHAMRATPIAANRALALLSKMFNLAEAWGLRPDGTNPCRHVERFPEGERRRFFGPEELSRLGAVLAESKRTGTERSAVIAAVRLLSLTGCRLSEILNLRWEDVDFDARCLRLPDAKAGARSVPLGSAALGLLSDLPRSDTPYVLGGSKPGDPLSIWSIEQAWRRIRTRADLKDARLHDLRHTVATMAAASGLNAFTVRDLLGHKTLTMANRYVKRVTDPLQEAAEGVSGRVAAMMSGRIQSAEVVPLARRQMS